ncbi:hypothetical protein [Psychrobacter immobilis]|uniref:hypothetical protein n=1 Tax=Psychrobacter immobilis TaxID=498 RepID=UPI0019183FF0|nr:hypothetical protein [Psychrobacter immobilis]
MSIIDQLEKTVTPAVIGERNSHDSVAYISLLEQFYAILASRLALPQVYSQFIRAEQVMVDRATESSLFEQLWQDKSVQQLMIRELSATHHIDESATLQLLINAAPLAYRELTVLANGQFLPAFLQGEQAALRQYLPMWSAPIITAPQNVNSASEAHPHIAADIDSVPVRDTSLDGRKNSHIDTSTIAAATAAYRQNAHTADKKDIGNTDVESMRIGDTDGHFIAHTGAIHANPSTHHLAENSSMKQEKVRTRNQRNDLLVRVGLLIVAIAAIGLAAWAILIRPNNAPPIEAAATVPVVVAPTPAPVAPTMTPIELIVGVDNSGSLYTCSATIGDAALQSTLQQALNTSFGEQASICELTVQAGVASSIANLPEEVLPNVLTMIRSTPFARLHLQNDRLMLEAPDSMLLQRLVTDMRTLIPAMVIDSTAPLPLPENNDADANAMNNTNNQFENEGPANNQYANDYNNSGSGEFQAADDDAGDRIVPTPAPNNYSNNANNIPSNIPNNTPNNTPMNNRPSGSISESEVDDMASTLIIAEPAQVRNK